MMRKLLPGFAWILATAAVMGQTPHPVHKATTPKHAGVFKMATGQLEKSAAQANRSGPEVIFNASELTNYYSVPGLDQEWLDEGTVLDRSPIQTEQCNGFEFVYCSTEADATQNSGTVTFAFYDETVVCSGPSSGANFALGGYLCAYDIVGLPLGDPNGAIQCWIVTVDLQGGFECPPALANTSCGAEWTTDAANSKLFGWSFIPRNDNTGPWLSKGGSQAAGIDNSFVWFDQVGALVGCFWFGGTPWANFAMKMFGSSAGNIAYNSCAAPGTNGVIYQAGTLTVATVVTFEVLNPTANNYSLVASLSPFDNPVGSAGQLLVALPVLSPTPILLTGGSANLTMPSTLPPLLYTQVIEHTGQNPTAATAVDLSNGIQHATF